MANENTSDDEISLTSTVESEGASEYEVEAVLAQKPEDRPEMDPGMIYLVKWQGYPLNRCTWEPETSFNNPDTMRDWEAKKDRISNGAESPFDFVAWQEEKEERKSRRAAKRRRLESREGRRSSQSIQDTPTVRRASPPTNSKAPSFRRPGPASSMFPDQIHPARQGLIRQPVPMQPPPVLSVGIKETAPKPKRALNDPKETTKRYTLSWKHKFEMASQNRQPEPNINQLDLRRPSDWDSVPSERTFQTGKPHFESSIEHNSSSAAESHHSGPGQDTQTIPSRANNGSISDKSSSWPREASLGTLHGNTTVKNGLQATNSQADHGQESSPHKPLRPLTRPPAGEFSLQFPPRVPRPGVKRFPSLPGNRWWNQGELYVTVYFGPNRTSLGEARICGFNRGETIGIFKSKNKKTKRIEIWFRDLCTLDQYQALCDGMSSNNLIGNGWMEGFDDTEVNIRRAAGSLWQKDQLAIARINNNEALLAYPPRSRDFDFLDNHVHEPRGYLNLTLRTSLGPIDRLWSTRNSQSQPRRVNNTLKENYAELGGVNAPSDPKPSQKSIVAQESDSQPASSRPTLKPLDTALLTPASSSRTSATHISDPGPTLPRKNNLSDTMDLDPRPNRGPTSSGGLNTAINTPISALNSPVLQSPSESPAMKRKSLPPADPMDLDTPHKPAAASGNAAVNPSLPQMDLDRFFRKKFGITFEKLADKKAQMETIFYVWFPENSERVQQEKKQVMDFLHKHTSLLFSNSVDVHWERFVQIVKKRTLQGVVLFHESFHDFEKIPYLRESLHKSASFWRISLSRPLQYVHRPLHAQRLFPHGGVFLLTEDFLVRQPAATMIILEWFKDWVKKKFPGNWKIMLRPGILDWLGEQVEKGDESRMCWWLGIIAQLRELSFCPHDGLLPTIEVDPIKSHVISPPRLPNYGSRTPDDSPGIPKDCSQEQRNTDHLGEFFAGWGLVNAHRFRRYFMITDLDPLERWMKWQHIELNYQNFFLGQNPEIKEIHARVFRGTSVPIPSVFEPPAQTQRPPKPSASSTPTSASSHRPASFAPSGPSRHSYGQGYQ